MKTTDNQVLTGAVASVGGIVSTTCIPQSHARSIFTPHDAADSRRNGDLSGKTSRATRRVNPSLPYLWQQRAQYFYERLVASGECLEWPYLDKAGYGIIQIGGKSYRAHRYAYELVHGLLPRHERVCILHACDNRACCNVAHLSIGTDKQNIHDAIRKGRFLHHRKLTPLAVRQIKAGLADHETKSALAKRFGVHYATIRQIANGRTWMDDALQPEVTQA
mgnify:FL=1